MFFLLVVKSAIPIPLDELPAVDFLPYLLHPRAAWIAQILLGIPPIALRGRCGNRIVLRAGSIERSFADILNPVENLLDDVDTEGLKQEKREDGTLESSGQQ